MPPPSIETTRYFAIHCLLYLARLTIKIVNGVKLVFIPVTIVLN
jgi:hypothetical protein